MPTMLSPATSPVIDFVWVMVAGVAVSNWNSMFAEVPMLKSPSA